MKSLSRVRLFAIPWTVAYQALLSMGFSRQKYWSGLPFPSPGKEGIVSNKLFWCDQAENRQYRELLRGPWASEENKQAKSYSLENTVSDGPAQEITPLSRQGPLAIPASKDLSASQIWLFRPSHSLLLTCQLEPICDGNPALTIQTMTCPRRWQNTNLEQT